MVLHLARQIYATGTARLFSYGEHVRDFVYVDDVVAATLLGLKAPSGIYNVGSGVGTSFNQLVEVLGKVMGQNVKVEYFPMPFGPETYQNNTCADLDFSHRRLGYAPQWDLEKGVKDYLSSLQRNDPALGGSTP